MSNPKHVLEAEYFFLCFFGITGIVLTLLALAGKWGTLATALTMMTAARAMYDLLILLLSSATRRPLWT